MAPVFRCDSCLTALLLFFRQRGPLGGLACPRFCRQGRLPLPFRCRFGFSNSSLGNGGRFGLLPLFTCGLFPLGA